MYGLIIHQPSFLGALTQENLLPSFITVCRLPNAGTVCVEDAVSLFVDIAEFWARDAWPGMTLGCLARDDLTGDPVVVLAEFHKYLDEMGRLSIVMWMSSAPHLIAIH